MKIKQWAKPENQEAILGTHRWNVSRLLELSKKFPVMDIPLDHINVFNTYSDLSLRQMVMHMKAVNDANLKYPIILDEDGEIMDGRHRLMKAMLQGKKTIKAVRFEENPVPCRIVEKSKKD